jgi:hypothetical protein
LKRRKNQNLSYRPSKRVESSQIRPSAMAGRGNLGLAQIQRGKGSDGKGKGVGSERAPRRTRLKAWSGLGKLGRGSPTVTVAAAVWWCWEQIYGERERRKGVGN